LEPVLVPACSEAVIQLRGAFHLPWNILLRPLEKRPPRTKGNRTGRNYVIGFQAPTSSFTETAILYRMVSTKKPVAHTPMVISISGKTADDQAQALIDPGGNNKDNASHGQGSLVAPGGGNDQEHEGEDGKHRGDPHPWDEVAMSVQPLEEKLNGVHVSRYIAVKGRKEFKQEKEYVEYHGVCDDPRQGPYLLFARVEIRYRQMKESGPPLWPSASNVFLEDRRREMP